MTKSQVMAFIEANPVFCWSTYHGGKPFTEIAMQICRHPADANCIAILNLADDPSAHLDKTPEQILKLMTCSPKKIRTVRTNGQPILMPLQACPANLVGRLASAVYDARAQMVGAHAGFRANVALAMAMALQFPARPVAQYAEERIYERFPSRKDEMLCRQFHQAEWTQRFGISQRLEDDRLREFAVRLIFVERPEDLPADARAKMAVWQLDRIGTDAAVPWLTSKAAIERIAALRVDAGPETLSHLAEIASYIGSLRAVDIAPPTLS